MNLEIITPEEKVFEGEITSIKVPGVNGEFQVLKDHSPLVSALEAGKVDIKTQEGLMHFDCEEGFIEVLRNRISLVVQKAEHIPAAHQSR